MTEPLDFEAAKARREAGMASSGEHAEGDVPGWNEHAYALLRQYACLQRDPWTIEQYRAWAYARGLNRPAEQRAFGGVTRRAIGQGVIERVGYAPAASSNGSPKPLYSRPARDLSLAA